MIQNESLECDVVDRDKLVEYVRDELDVLRGDLDWLLHVGVLHVMDKLIEHPKSMGAASWIHHATFMVGEEVGRAGLKSEIDA